MSLAHVDVDFAGTCDSTGAATIQLQALASQYGVLKLMGQTTGSAQWTVLIKGRPVAPGRGPRVDLGPIATQPGEQISISITGAAAGAAVSGKLHGIGASSAQEALSNYVPSPNTIALDAFNGSILIGTIDNVGTSDVVTKTLALPGGSQGVGFAVSAVAPNQTPGSVVITGVQTNLPYIVVNTGPVAWATELFPEDSSVTCTVTGNAGAVPSRTFIHAYTYNPRVRFQGSSPAAGPVPLAFDGTADAGLPGGGVQATCNLGATTGKRWVCGMVSAELTAGAGAVASVVAVRLWDGASGSILLKGWRIGQTTVVGSSDRIQLAPIAIPGSIGNQMTLDFSAAVATGFEQCSFGAWLE